MTRSRVAHVLAAAADLLGTEGWNPGTNPLMHAIDRATGFVPGKSSRDAEATSLAAWDALGQHLAGRSPRDWETGDNRTAAEVLGALYAAAKEVSSC
ncbi:hypothetical protein [Streptomyces sp. SLBN-134]|uniref:DUF6197 family protein n=1 Tax=Streptomyces sp. SLBN-134 TaxID=2768456 RepID=UPI001151052F|nr:hypothetical protein [Streptomyces sp. SLBN-134]